ncbi:hypothetical protein T07_5478 [Trichinella nelsoni]|uniref:Uncharacterized protein n=1 Tax=Trichinella nelsoni TaxID=6336 RepID=A0A0V0RN16_9BILA|nr:hypothetical protein T07_5478 [Trichinella nelsoni]
MNIGLNMLNIVRFFSCPVTIASSAFRYSVNIGHAHEFSSDWLLLITFCNFPFHPKLQALLFSNPNATSWPHCWLTTNESLLLNLIPLFVRLNTEDKLYRISNSKLPHFLSSPRSSFSCSTSIVKFSLQGTYIVDPISD